MVFTFINKRIYVTIIQLIRECFIVQLKKMDFVSPIYQERLFF